MQEFSTLTSLVIAINLNRHEKFYPRYTAPVYVLFL